MTRFPKFCLTLSTLLLPMIFIAQTAGDLSLSKTTIAAGITDYGLNVPFTITITNEGPTAVTNVQLVDYIPIGYDFFQPANSDWTYDPLTRKATTTFTGIVGVGGSEVVTIRLQPQAVSNSDDWINAAEITGATDLNGNSIIDSDSVYDDIQGNDINDDDYSEVAVPVYDLALRKKYIGPATGYRYGDVADFDITVYNQGNIDVQGVVVREYFAEGFDFELLDNPGWRDDQPIPYFKIPSVIGAGDSSSFTVRLTLQPDNFDGRAWDNFAGIDSAFTTAGDPLFNDADSNQGTNTNVESSVLPGSDADDQIDGGGPNANEDEDDHDVASLDIYDLAITKTRLTAAPSYSYTQGVTFENLVTNQGNQGVDSVLIVDYIPCGYTFDPLSNVGWTYDNVERKARYTMAPGPGPNEDMNVELVLEVVACQDMSVTAWDNFSEIEALVDTFSVRRDDIDSTPDAIQGNDIGAEKGTSTDDQIDDNGTVDEDDHDVASLEVVDWAMKIVDDAVATPPIVGEDIGFTITGYSQGNITFTSVDIAVDLADGFAFNQLDNPLWTVSPSDSNVLLYTTSSTLIPNDSVEIPLVLELLSAPGGLEDYTIYTRLLQLRDATGNRDDDADSFVSNTPAERSVALGSADDDNIFAGGPNVGEDQDDHDPAGYAFFDLALTKTSIGNQVASVGDIIDYNITVFNQGILSASRYELSDRLPCGLEFVDGQNPGWDYNDVTRVASLEEVTPLPGSDQESYTLRLRVIECNDAEAYRNVVEITDAETPDDNDPTDIDSTPDNDVPTEDDQDDDIIQVIFGADLGDFVWEDLNGDGIQDLNEPGIAGVTVHLFDQFGILIESTVTNAMGAYLITGVPQGSYYLQFETTDTDLVATEPGVGLTDTDSNVDGSNGPNTTSIFVFSGIANRDDIDAGFYRCAKICGKSWYDLDRDSRREIDENGINGLLVDYYRLNTITNTYELVESALTGADPNTPSGDGYFEACVRPGTYYLFIAVPPSGLVPAEVSTGGDPFTNNDFGSFNGVFSTESFTINSGAEQCDFGAGFYPMATICGVVWMDADMDGHRDNTESLVPDILVELIDEQDIVVSTDVTDAEGNYEHSDIQAQDYYLRFSSSNGISFTIPLAPNTTADKDSDVDESNGPGTTRAVTFSPDQDIHGIDAGLVSAVLPVVWSDISLQRVDEAHILSWSVSTEINAEKYVVERSIGATSYSVVASMSADNSDGGAEYEIRDTDIEKAGIYTYRIKQIDFDGSIDYSATRSIEVEGTRKIELYPNPTSSRAHLAIDTDDEDVSIEVFDVAGQMVLQQYDTSSGARVVDIDLSTLLQGVYTVKVAGQGWIYQERLLVVR